MFTGQLLHKKKNLTALRLNKFGYKVTVEDKMLSLVGTGEAFSLLSNGCLVGALGEFIVFQGF